MRKRDPDFPANIRMYTKVEQPARRPHSDCSPKGAHMNLERAFPGQESFWQGKDFDVIKYVLHSVPTCLFLIFSLSYLRETYVFFSVFGDLFKDQTTTGP